MKIKLIQVKIYQDDNRYFTKFFREVNLLNTHLVVMRNLDLDNP